MSKSGKTKASKRTVVILPKQPSDEELQAALDALYGKPSPDAPKPK